MGYDYVGRGGGGGGGGGGGPKGGGGGGGGWSKFGPKPGPMPGPMPGPGPGPKPPPGGSWWPRGGWGYGGGWGGWIVPEVVLVEDWLPWDLVSTDAEWNLEEDPLLLTSALRVSGVGAGPGDEWMQTKTAQEKKQGYLKTDVMTLRMKADQLLADVTNLLSQIGDGTGSDPESVAELQQIKARAATLAFNAKALEIGQGGSFGALQIEYSTIKVLFDEILSRAGAPEPEPAPAPPPAPKPGQPVPPPAPPPAPKPPVVLKKKKNVLLWGAIGAAAAVAVTKLAGVW